MIILKPSTRKAKKWMVVIPTGQGTSTVHFGADGYSDYPEHQDDNRKRNYISRHRKNEDWTRSGLETAGFWSRWLLWNKPSLSESIKDIERRFNVSIEHQEPRGLALLRPNSLIQAIRFDRTRWTADQARKWLTSHNFHPIKRVDKTAGELRYRLRPPDQFRSYATKQTGEGINFIIGFH